MEIDPTVAGAARRAPAGVDGSPSVVTGDGASAIRRKRRTSGSSAPPRCARSPRRGSRRPRRARRSSPHGALVTARTPRFVPWSNEMGGASGGCGRGLAFMRLRRQRRDTLEPSRSAPATAGTTRAVRSGRRLFEWSPSRRPPHDRTAGAVLLSDGRGPRRRPQGDRAARRALRVVGTGRHDQELGRMDGSATRAASTVDGARHRLRVVAGGGRTDPRPIRGDNGPRREPRGVDRPSRGRPTVGAAGAARRGAAPRRPRGRRVAVARSTPVRRGRAARPVAGRTWRCARTESPGPRRFSEVPRPRSRLVVSPLFTTEFPPDGTRRRRPSHREDDEAFRRRFSRNACAGRTGTPTLTRRGMLHLIDESSTTRHRPWRTGVFSWVCGERQVPRSARHWY
ncbi:hypothetical protein FHR81_001864 [Actinoalloteichus hoggarensis]|uniref:Uncharacterized protein n=1 Tax=Actinoalloteichus hoggarensis TaxID=1470176 RepID=A0A221W4V6_9PSEU|nr:hypothetical protein AHOG_16345 [Actinoalloteichus hoggarensis]MBB5920826.1 hypothetical protein [Actinoalloteichus hoggarensis]